MILVVLASYGNFPVHLQCFLYISSLKIERFDHKNQPGHGYLELDSVGQ